MSPEPQTSTASQATLREFLAVAFRRRWVIIGLFLATTTTVVTLSLSTKADFISTGRVLIKRGEKESLLTPSRSVGPWEEDLASEVEVVRSFPVLQRTREFLKVQTDSGAAPVKVDPKMVNAEVMGKSNVLAIAYSDPDPRVARRVCDALMSAYIEFRQKDMSLAFPLRFFESELARVESELNRKVEERREFVVREGIVDLGEQRRNLLGQMVTLADRRNQSAAELAEATAALRQMNELKSNPNIDLPTFSGLFSNEQALVDLKRRVIDQEAHVAQLRERYWEHSPEMVTAGNTLDTLKSMLVREVDSRLAMAASRIRTLEARQAVFDRDYAAIPPLLAAMPDQERRIDALDGEIKLLKDRFTDLTEKGDQARVTQNTTPSLTILVLSPASRAIPRNSRDYIRLALAPAFSVIVGLGLAFFIDGLDQTVHTSGHAEEAIELPVFAALTERRRRTS
jgi:succinoglycan biosynthesis transport protein ExoP